MLGTVEDGGIVSIALPVLVRLTVLRSPSGEKKKKKTPTFEFQRSAQLPERKLIQLSITLIHDFPVRT